MTTTATCKCGCQRVPRKGLVYFGQDCPRAKPSKAQNKAFSLGNTRTFVPATAPPPARSWWVGVPPAGFADAAAEERARLQGEAGKARFIVPSLSQGF
jgi:hypothetical protein